MLQERGLVLLGGGEDEEEEVTKLKIVHYHSVGVLAYYYVKRVDELEAQVELLEGLLKKERKRKK